MQGSWRLFDILGIQVNVHWTFLLLLAAVLVAPLAAGHGWVVSAGALLFVVLLFACVLLHELGHVLAAQRFGVSTEDITLLPIGGVARLERMPEEPRQELAIALAGPAVNATIAASLGLGILFSAEPGQLAGGGLTASSAVVQLLWANVVLALFNLFPAFPMDGGRVLRALLSLWLPHARATQLAAGVGQLLAVLLGLIGLFVNWMLLLVAIFVYVAARREAEQARLDSLLAGLCVGDVMSYGVSTISADAPLHAIADQLAVSGQRHFPVVSGRSCVGMVSSDQIFQAIAEDRGDESVRQVMRSDMPTAEEHQGVAAALNRMRMAQCSSLPVVRAGMLVGLLTADRLDDRCLIASGRRAVMPA